MKEIELTPELTLVELISTALVEDVLLTDDGEPLVRVMRDANADVHQWAAEHSPEAIARGKQAREGYATGKCTSLEEVWRELGLDQTLQGDSNL